MKEFKTKEEFLKELEYAIVMRFYGYPNAQNIIDWAKKQNDLITIIRDCPMNWKYYFLQMGWKQFERGFNWDYLEGCDWVNLLIKYSKYAGKCKWDKLDKWDWRELLVVKPRFVKYCNLDELDIWDWKYIVEKLKEKGRLTELKDSISDGQKGHFSLGYERLERAVFESDLYEYDEEV
ncbi:MAG: hypothetical protein DRP09_18005 [Candidatus Thorarchaeota archaeon]|nr:MAG: hypothetical protein DRP09_18005 [Candidatus Thorarchaeota archaeon]